MTGDIIFPFNIFTNINMGIFSICKIGLRIIKLVSGRSCLDTYKLVFCLIERILPFFGSNSYRKGIMNKQEIKESIEKENRTLVLQCGVWYTIISRKDRKD